MEYLWESTQCKQLKQQYGISSYSIPYKYRALEYARLLCSIILIDMTISTINAKL